MINIRKLNKNIKMFNFIYKDIVKKEYQPKQNRLWIDEYRIYFGCIKLYRSSYFSYDFDEINEYIKYCYST